MATDPARSIIQLSLAVRLEFGEPGRVSAVQSSVWRVASNWQKTVLGNDALRKDDVLRYGNPFVGELSFHSKESQS